MSGLRGDVDARDFVPLPWQRGWGFSGKGWMKKEDITRRDAAGDYSALGHECVVDRN